jgi:guanine deaminase
MIVAGLLAVPEEPRTEDKPRRRLRLEEGWLRLDGPRIAAATPGPCPHTVDLGGPGSVVFPGFIDAHFHLPQFDSVGADGLELLAWLERVIFPAEARWVDPAVASDMSARAAARMLSVGTTGVAAYATVHHESAVAAAEALHKAGLRAMVGQVLMDRNAPADLVRPATQLLDEAERLAAIIRARFRDGRIESAVTPRFAVACSEELLHGAGRLAAALGGGGGGGGGLAPVQTHLAESRAECELVGHLFPRRSYTRVYLEAGLLGPRSVLAHGIWLDDQDRAILKRSQSVVAHCPTANLFLRSGHMDRARHLAAGVRLALGSDVAGGPDVSMVRVARAMIETAKRRGGRPPAASEAWWQITAGNAAALGWPFEGRLAAGASADIVVARPAGLPDGWWGGGGINPMSRLLYSWDDRWIEATIVAGRVGYTRS